MTTNKILKLKRHRNTLQIHVLENHQGRWIRTRKVEVQIHGEIVSQRGNRFVVRTPQGHYDVYEGRLHDEPASLDTTYLATPERWADAVRRRGPKGDQQ